MRSLVLTSLLAITAAILGVLAVWQLREGNLNSLLGTPPVALGEKIYPDFDPEAVAFISVESGETQASFTKTPLGWIATAPWQDRMDPRAAIALLTFANTTTAQDIIPRDKLDPALSGLGTGNTELMFRSESGEILARFRLGRRTPWLHLTDEETPQTIPTTYLLPRERGRKSHVYAATGDILPLLKDGFRNLRDHRPFYINPLAVEKIRIRTAQGELTLGRANPGSPWRITKPLDLPTDPSTVKDLLEGLYNLQATKLADRSQITLPSDVASPDNTRIAVTHFGSDAEAILDILPPETPESRETQATISDRPETIFTLPLKPDPDLISIPDLPLTVNDLRDPTLTNLNIPSIRGIAIETATTPTILISRQPPAPWTATIGGNEQPANEQRLYDLLKAATDTRALSFETDAAPEDLSPWGLNRPILTLTFLAADNQTLAISFGLGPRGNLFAKRKDSPTVMRIDNSFLEKIAVKPHDWRHARLWSLSVVDLTAITRTQAGSPPLDLSYNWKSEKWQATRGGEDLTAELDPDRANFLVKSLENLEVSRWLAPGDENAVNALKTPALSFRISEKIIDDFGDETGEERHRTLTLAADPAAKLIYGSLDSDSFPFTLPAETFLKLNIPLLEE